MYATNRLEYAESIASYEQVLLFVIPLFTADDWTQIYKTYIQPTKLQKKNDLYKCISQNFSFFFILCVKSTFFRIILRMFPLLFYLSTYVLTAPSPGCNY